MEGDCNVYAHSSLWMRPTGEWSINAKMVYISIHFWNGSESYHPFLISNFTKDVFFFLSFFLEKMTKKSLFWSKILWQVKKKVKNAKLLENHVQTQCQECFFFFFSNFWIRQYFWKILTKERKKTWFFCQNIIFFFLHLLALVGQNFKKCCLD